MEPDSWEEKRTQEEEQNAAQTRHREADGGSSGAGFGSRADDS